MEWTFTFFTFSKTFLECGDNEKVIHADGETIEEALPKAVKELPTTGVWELAEAWADHPQLGQDFTNWTG
tara:strand:+ start:181 stop:390 length:210 start_codon:yes stop_codon:yes gene_type:complete